jgi:hypothetical protein
VGWQIAKLLESPERPTGGQLGVRRGVGGVVRDGLVEILDPCPQPLDRPTVRGVPAPKVERIGLETRRRGLDERVARLSHELVRQRAGERPGQFILHGEDIFQRPIIGLGPELISACGVD